MKLMSKCSHHAWVDKMGIWTLTVILTKNTLGVKKVVAKNLKSKWAAKACVVLLVTRIKF